ncbi:oligosaccharide flippase family protein [Rhodocyclaceae bacterium SMB388]
MSVRRALGIRGISQLVSFVLGFASVVVVSRLLTPEEIGIFSVAVAVLGLAHIFREFGVGQYLIQAKQIGLQERRAAFTVSLVTAWALAGLLFLVRDPLAVLYGHRGVAEVLTLLAINFMIMPFGTPLLSMMNRDLQFGRISIGQICGSVAHASVTIGAAMMGESYLSMAWGALASHIVKTSVLNLMRPGEIFMMPTFRGIGNVVRFGSVASMASLVKELGSSAPDLIFGRTLGFAEVALYSRAVGLKRMLLQQLVGLVRSVYFPTYAKKLREGHDPAKLYAQVMNYLVAVVAPALGFMAIMAEPLIVFLFGDQWTRSVPIATMICAFTMLTTPYMLFSSSLTAAGRVGLLLKVELAVQWLLIAVLLSSIWLPLEQVAALLFVAFVGEAVFSQLALKKAFGLSFPALMTAVAPAFRLLPFSLIGPLAIALVAGHQDEGAITRLAQLLIGGGLFAVGWVGGAFYTKHPIADEVRLALRKIRGR